MTIEFLEVDEETGEATIVMSDDMVEKFVGIGLNFVLTCNLLNLTTDQVIDQLLEKYEENKSSTTP